APGNCFLEWVEIDDDQIDSIYFEFLRLAQVTGVIPTKQNPTEDGRVQGLYAASKNRRISCEFFNRCYRVAKLFDEFLCATCRYKLNALFAQLMNYRIEIVFIKYRNEGSGNFVLGHGWV